MATTKALSVKLSVRDDFSANLKKLVTAIKRSEKQLNAFSRAFDSATNKVANNVDVLNRKMDKFGNNVSKNFTRVTNTLRTQIANVEKKQSTSITNIQKAYKQMVKEVNADLKSIGDGTMAKNVSIFDRAEPRGMSKGLKNIIGNIPISSIATTNKRLLAQEKEQEKARKAFEKQQKALEKKQEKELALQEKQKEKDAQENEDFLKNVISGNLGSIVSKLGIAGTIVSVVGKIGSMINNTLDTGFNILNTISGNMLTMEGMRNALEEAMGFETGRASLDLFLGDKQKGAEAYKTATKVATETFASETDTIDITSKLAMLGVHIDEKQLKALVDVAATRPTVGTEHIGLAVQEAIEGRITMLKNYGINNYKLQDYYNSLKKSNPTLYKELDGALNKKGTAGDAQKYFNLVTSYIEQSPMGGYAEQYANTLKGKLERISGIISKAKADVMGIDTETGLAKTNGAYKYVAEAVDMLKDTLESTQFKKMAETFGAAIGKMAKSLASGLDKLVKNVNWEKVGNALAAVGETVGKWLERLADSGVLEKLADSLPTIVEGLLKYQAVKTVAKHPVASTYMGTEIANKTIAEKTGMSEKQVNFAEHSILGFLRQAPVVGSLATMADTYLQGKDWFDSFLKPKDEDIQEQEISTKGYVTDMELSRLLNDNVKLNSNQKQEIKEYISGDDAPKYYININTIQANNFDEIMDSLKKSVANR